MLGQAMVVEYRSQFPCLTVQRSLLPAAASPALCFLTENLLKSLDKTSRPKINGESSVVKSRTRL